MAVRKGQSHAGKKSALDENSLKALRLLRSAEKCLGLRLCYHDYLRRFPLPYAYTVHESAACLRIKREHTRVCHGFCGGDGTVDRQIREYPEGWLHTCPLGMRKIAVAVFYEGGLAGVLFADCFPRRDCIPEDSAVSETAAATGQGYFSEGGKQGGQGGREPRGELPEPEACPWSEEELIDRQRLLCGVARQLETLIRGENATASEDRRGTIMRYIEQTVDGPADLEGLGRALSLSPSRAGHLVRELFHRSFRDLALEARANRAALLLAGTELEISEIAYRLGFTDQSHFTRIFRQRFRQTPAAYRRSFRTHR